MLTAPEPRKDLYMYLSVSKHAVSAVLLRDQGVQQPIYYIRKTMVDAKTRYLPLEKLVLVLVHATQEATLLLSGLYCLRINRVSFTVVVEEV